MMLALMFDPIFKDLFILSNDVGIEKTTITTRYEFETLIHILCSTYKNTHPFAKNPSNSTSQE